MRKLLIIFALLAPIIGRAQLSSSALTNLINTLFPDNVTGAITPSDLRNGMNAVVLSVPNFIDGGVTPTEFSYGSSVNSDIQAQLGARELLANKNQSSGYAGLDSNGDLSLGIIPNPNHAYGSAALSAGTYTSSDTFPAWTTSATYPPQYVVSLRCTSINTGGELLKIGSGPAKAIVLSSGLSVPSGDINPNAIHEFIFNGNADKWVIVNPASMGAFSSLFTLSTNASVITVDLADGGLTLAKMASLAPNKVMGRDTGTGAPQALSVGSSLSTAGATLDVPSGGITLPKVQNIGTAKIIGRASAGTGVPEEIVIGTGLSVGTPGGIPTLTAAGSVSVPIWVPPPPALWADYIFTDFTAGSTPTTDGWTGTGTGTGSTASGATGTELHPGIIQCLVGTQTIGCYSVTRNSSSRVLGANSTNVVDWLFSLSNASDATDSYYMDAGFGDNGTTATDTDAVLVRYSHDLNSGNVVVRVVAAGTPAETNTSVPIPTAVNSYFHIRIEASSALVKSWVYTSAATNALPDVTTGIPGAGQALAPMLRMSKRAGTNNRQFNLDAVQTWVGYPSPGR